ncbi:aldo/keto reductase [Sphingobacterium sp. SG20118]|uniref:aldo/keto reductase n=1 Tax=Sphingobacterium sp. SG20118 TaxID=3367156 RepID=UPI0037DFC8BC
MYNLGIDKIILGTAGLGGVWGKVIAEESVSTMVDALSRGVCALDTAPAYGDAEQFVGQALARWTGKRPAISTKVGRLKSYRTDQATYDYTRDGMRKSVDSSLDTLGVQQIDVLFLHEPAAIPPAEIEFVVSQMLFFKEQGYAKKIGIGGNLPQQFAPYLKDNVFDVIMEYNRLNACSVEALRATIPNCDQSNKEYYAASPLNMGLLGCNFNEFSNFPPSWLDMKSIEQAKRINEIAERYQIPLDVLALRFLYSIPASFKVVLGAADNDQLMSSLQAFDAGILPAHIYNEILQTLN